MPFSIRIYPIVPNQGGIELGLLQDPIVNNELDISPNRFSTIEIKQGETSTVFSFRNTLLFKEGDFFCYKQALRLEKGLPYHAYLKGTLTGEEPKKVLLIHDAERYENFPLAFIPRTSNHYIQLKEKCYPCESVLYKKNVIEVRIVGLGIPIDEFHQEFH